MLRLKYLVYFPILCSCVAVVLLVCWFLTDCSTTEDVAHKIIREEVAKRTSGIQQRMDSLKTKEDKFLSEIKDLKRLIQQQQQHKQQQTQETRYRRSTETSQLDANIPYIFGITPTYTRLTQKADLTRLCQTLLHVRNFHWMIIEDSEVKTELVKHFLAQCGVKYTHLAVKTMPRLARNEYEPRWLKARGVEQRNAGLKWLRDAYRHDKDVKRVVYLMDDDNTYDLEIFEEMRKTRKVSVWPVGLAGGLKWEGPICKDGKMVKFHAVWDLTRPFPIDMAGFAINLQMLLDNPLAEIDVDAARGHLESSLLRQLIKPQELEPVPFNCSKILVWHTQTSEANLKQEKKLWKRGRQSPPLEV